MTTTIARPTTLSTTLLQFLPERDYVTVGYLPSQIRQSSSVDRHRHLSVTFVHPTQPVEIFINFLCYFVIVPQQSANLHAKLYGNYPGKLLRRGLNTRGVAKQRRWICQRLYLGNSKAQADRLHFRLLQLFIGFSQCQTLETFC